VIVIDPGHGGKDPGTRGCGVIREKDLVLSLATIMAEELRARTDFKVVLTRGDDRYVDLHGRVRIARMQQGDLFLSIHANSARSSSAHGAEVYFLSPRGATDQAASELANRENAAHMVGMGDGEEVDDTMMSILMDLQSSGILRRSGQFAELTLEHLGAVPSMDTRFIKQARFAVLRTLSMPSILVEVGYLSNRSEARRLRRQATQAEIGRAMANAVIAYCEHYGEKGQPKIVRQRTHKVRRGDTLWDLARVYDTSVVTIRELNHLKTSSLRVGQDLILP
jgi:N-acetylmuramoyl-L-alanine amidase